MKKKTVIILTAVLTVLTLTMLIASAVVLTVNTGESSDKYLGKDLTADATEITASTNEALTRFVTDGNVNTFWQGERRGSYIQFYFEKGIEYQWKDTQKDYTFCHFNPSIICNLPHKILRKKRNITRSA